MEQPRPEQLTIRLDERDHVLGPADAAYTLVEYGDFECPPCARAAWEVELLRARLGDALRFAFRHFPLPELHPHAVLAAEAAEAAGAQGRFWDMHHALYSWRPALDRGGLVAVARRLGLDVARFARELDDGLHAAHVDLQAQGARMIGAAGTPAFFIDGRRHAGPPTADALETALRAA